jgi:hypothetical protein
MNSLLIARTKEQKLFVAFRVRSRSSFANKSGSHAVTARTQSSLGTVSLFVRKAQREKATPSFLSSFKKYPLTLVLMFSTVQHSNVEFELPGPLL